MALYGDAEVGAILNYLAGTTDLGDAAALRQIAALVDSMEGDGSPEGAVAGPVGALYTDTTNGTLYIKETGTGDTGWVSILSSTLNPLKFVGAYDANANDPDLDTAPSASITKGSVYMVSVAGTFFTAVVEAGDMLIAKKSAPTLESDWIIAQTNINGAVTGPASATSGALALFSGTSGKAITGTGSATMDGNLTISKSGATINVNDTGGVPQVILQNNGANAWAILRLGNGTFALRSYDAAGYALVVNPATGKFTVSQAGATGGVELGTSGPRLMSGTGSPEGVVTAPVGSIWTDTAATTGAIRWIKASGTGNTGWVVEHGDTGRRDLSAESLLNSWTVAASRFSVRRMGNMVEVELLADNTSASANAVYALPSGFRPQAVTYWGAANRSTTSDDAFSYSIAGSTGEISITSSQMSGSVGYISATYLTADAWPSSLPGTA